MTDREHSIGQADFVHRHGLWTDAQAAAAEDALRQIDENNIELVRLAYPDQHGILRGKAVVAEEFPATLRNGCRITTTLLAKDTSHKTVYPVFTPGGGFDLPEMEGAGDFIMVPDPTTFRILPWAPDTAWVLCDAYFQTGAPNPFAPRSVLRNALDRAAGHGFDFVTGIEIEFHIFKLEDPRLEARDIGQPPSPPDVSLTHQGFNYLTEFRFDQAEPLLQILRRTTHSLGLPLRTVESEFGPSQVEFTFHPGTGLESADRMMLFRSMVKQVCRRHGYHATFMCQPGLPGMFCSGWHLHQSLIAREGGENVFMPDADDDLLSTLGRQFVAGVLEHAPAGSVFSTPTLNGYKRYKPNSLAPDRAIWGRDNKGAMVRAVSGAGDRASRIENRIGDPAANPYLYLASQLFAGLDGIERDLSPPAPTDDPYAADATALPRNLIDAVRTLKSDRFFRSVMGDRFVDYIVYLKEMEIERFLATVTDWEHREYFELY